MWLETFPLDVREMMPKFGMSACDTLKKKAKTELFSELLSRP